VRDFILHVYVLLVMKALANQ